MAALGMILQLVAVVLVIFIIAKISVLFWQMLAWLRTELSPATPRALAIRIGGMVIGLGFSFFFLSFAFFWIGANPGGYSAPWRPLWSAGTFIPPTILVLFAFSIVYLCFRTRTAKIVRLFRWNVCPLALGLTLLVECSLTFLAWRFVHH